MRDVQCKKCSSYQNEWCGKVNDSPDPELIRDCPKFRQKTNGDAIRSFTDEELAEYLAEIVAGFTAQTCDLSCLKQHIKRLSKYYVKYLQKPYEGFPWTNDKS
jgi:hypothetical protein